MNLKLWMGLFSLYLISFILVVYGQMNPSARSAQEEGSVSVVVIPATVSIVAIPDLSTTVTIAPGVSVVTIGNTLTSTTISGFSSKTVTIGPDFTNDGDSDSFTSARHTRTATINSTIFTSPGATTHTVSVITQQRSPSGTSTALGSLSSTLESLSTDSQRDITTTSETSPAQTSSGGPTSAHKSSSSLVPLLVGIFIPITLVASILLWCYIRNRKTKKMKEDQNITPPPQLPPTRRAPSRPPMTATTGSWDTEGRLKLGPFVPANVQELARTSPEYLPRRPIHFRTGSPESILTTSPSASDFPSFPSSSPNDMRNREAPPRPRRPSSLTPSVIEAMQRAFAPFDAEIARDDVDSVGSRNAGRSETAASISRHNSPNYSRPLVYHPQPLPGHARSQQLADQAETPTPRPLHIVKDSHSDPSMLDEVAFDPHPNQHRQGSVANFHEVDRQRFQDSDESNEEERQRKRSETVGALEGTLASEDPEHRQRSQYPASSVYSTNTDGQPRTQPGGEMLRDRGERGRYEVRRPQGQVDDPDWSVLKGNFI